jgi:hypothetical protein
MKSILRYIRIPLILGKDPFMTHRITYFFITILVGLLLWACSPATDTEEEDDDTVQISLSLLSQSTGETTNTINTSSPGLLRIRVRDASGDALVSQLVSASTTKGTLSPEDGTAITNSSGIATISILAGNDSGAGEVTVTVSSESETIAFQIGSTNDSSTSEIGAIEFVSADPNTISLKGTGGVNRQETSIVTFRVVDSDGLEVSDQEVTFSLSTEKGGLSLSAESAVSDSSGLVQVVVSSGTIPTPVSVEAEVEAFGVRCLSSELIVSTGLPDQDSFSISLSNLSPEAYQYDGITVTASIQAADHFNNPIPDGTTVYFRTESGGSITPSCSTTDGACSVTWTSGGERPTDGLVTIIAYVLGEESFTDVNGNGVFDSGDSLNDDLPEAWVDNDKDGVYDSATEEFVDFDSDFTYNSGNSQYNGTLCSDLSICTTELVDVRDDIELAMSTSGAAISISPNPINIGGSGTVTVSLTISDLLGNSMPSGTTVEVETSNGEIIGDDSWTIPDGIDPSTYEIYVKASADDGTSGILTVRVTSPKGLKTVSSFTVTDPS